MMELVRVDNGGPACRARAVDVAEWAASDGLVTAVLYDSDVISQRQVARRR